MISSLGSSPSRSSISSWRTETHMYGKGLRALSVSALVLICAALALVFFYAPNDADQGFVQKIFYIHVPLAIAALFGFIAGGVLAILHLRSGDSRCDVRSYHSIHPSCHSAL